MEMAVEDLDNNVTRIVLQGRMDTAGAGAVDLRFSVVAGAKRTVIVDLSGLSFLSSLGIRVLLTGAKTVRSKGGKLALLSPDASVLAVLRMARIDDLVPVFDDLDAAVRFVVS